MRPDDLAALTMRVLLERNPGVDPAQIDDVILGCANQAGEDNRNVARMSALLAGLHWWWPKMLGRVLNDEVARIGAVQAPPVGDGDREGGDRSMDAAAFLRGYPLAAGDRLKSEP